MNNEEKGFKLSELANKLFEDIKDSIIDDIFKTITIIVPNVLMSQWLKSYWLKNEDNGVLMNVKFVTLNSFLPFLVNQRNYRLISHKDLKKIIISILIDENENNNECEIYYKGNPIRLNDFADTLATLYLEYYKDCFENLDSWASNNENDNSKDRMVIDTEKNKYGLFEYELWQKIIRKCNEDTGSIELPNILSKQNDANTKGLKENVYLFGFSYKDKVYSKIVENCESSIKSYQIKKDNNPNVLYEVSAAPSMIREIENVHSKICEILFDKTKEANVSDFYVIAPNMKDYVNTIERVFRQDDENFPSIPYVIRSSNNKNDEMLKALKSLHSVIKNKYYTRLDFYNLVSNPFVKNKRNIVDKEINDWMKCISQLKIHRNHDFLEDWTYFKRRLVLSKLSSIDFEDNLVSLNDGDYLPYSSISLDDESIHRLIQVIDDLDRLIEMFGNQEYLNNEDIDLLKTELDKWFLADDNDDFSDKIYRNIVDGIELFKKVNKGNVSIDTFFYMLNDDVSKNTIQKGNAFIQGVTFSDLDINTIVTAKYVFFIGASSANTPVKQIKNELDLRKNIPNTNEQDAFDYLYQNTTEKMFISYVSKDLKTDEDFYLTPLVEKLNIDKKSIKEISLDENREFKKLYTCKEITDKRRYDGLLVSGEKTNKKTLDGENVFHETVTVSDMENYLKDPLVFKSSKLFNYEDNFQEEIKKEWEIFKPDTLEESVLVEKVVLKKIRKTFDYNKMFSELKLCNLIPTISKEYEEYIYDTVVKYAANIIDNIESVTGGEYSLLEPKSIPLSSDNGEWILTSKKHVVLCVKDNTRRYLELKKLEKDNLNISKFLRLYVTSLMDVATDESLELNTEYEVVLIKGENPESEEKYKKQQWKFKVSPKAAKEKLKEIHKRMGDYKENVALPIDVAGVDIKVFSDLEYKLNGYNPVDVWKYFKHNGIFVPESDYGYSYFDFDPVDFQNKLNKHLELFIPFQKEKR